MHGESAALRTSPSWLLGSGCVDCSPCCAVLSNKFDEYDCSVWFDNTVFLLYCCLCTFLFMSRKCLNVSVLSTVQPFGYLLMKYPLSPETGSALLQPLGSRATGGWLRRATTSVESCCPCSPSHRHSSAPGILQPSFWCQVPQLSVLGPHKAVVFPPALLMLSESPLGQPRNSNSGFYFHSNSLERALHICNISSCFLQHLCKGYLQAAQWIWWDDWHRASPPFQFIRPLGPTRVWWCLCPDIAQFPLQPSFSLPCFFDGSNFCQQAGLSSPSHCKKEGQVCSVKKLLSACRQVLRSSCGCAVTHIHSRDADVS